MQFLGYNVPYTGGAIILTVWVLCCQHAVPSHTDLPPGDEGVKEDALSKIKLDLSRTSKQRK